MIIKLHPILFSLLLMLALSGCAADSSTLVPSPTLSPAPTSTLTPLPSPTAIVPPTATAPPTPTATGVVAAALDPATPSPTPVDGVLKTFQSNIRARRFNTVGATCDIERVVLISIDGLRPDALAQAETPHLDALRVSGSYTAQASAVLPSVTLVNHASMLGGMGPDKHGIYWNVNDADLGKINGPTLFSVVQEASLSTAMVVGKPKLEDLVLPNSVDQYVYAGPTDMQVVEQAISLIETGLPDILFIHLPDVDSAGHATGWMSLNQLQIIQRTDTFIGEIVAALEAGDHLAHTLLIITTDHGGKGTRHGSDIPENVTIPWLAVGPGVPQNHTLEAEVVIYDTAATALHALRLPQPDAWDGQPVMELFDQFDCQP